MLTAVKALELAGTLQCIFILAIILLRAIDRDEAKPTLAFFAALGFTFGLPLPVGFVDLQPATWYLAAGWLVWVCIPALSYLLIVQVETGRLPENRHYAVLLLPLFAPPAALYFTLDSQSCSSTTLCPDVLTLMQVFGAIAGAVVLLLLCFRQKTPGPIPNQREARNRYWLVVALIAFNILSLGINLPWWEDFHDPIKIRFLRTVFSLTFVYLVTTLMFRIDPMPLAIQALRGPVALTAEERKMAERIKELMEFDKLYQEPLFGRADLARELNASENIISRVINTAFAKSFRKFINDCRVEEAKQLLRDSNYHVTQIAFDVGFNSISSFNRVFKEATGQSAVDYRAACAAAQHQEDACVAG